MTEAEEYRLKDEADVRLDAVVADRGPHAGEVWRHYKGPAYLVLGVSIMEDSGQGLVHYRPLQGRIGADGRPGRPRNRTRKIEVWHQQVTRPDGATVPRFRRLGRRELPEQFAHQPDPLRLAPLPQAWRQAWADNKERLLHARVRSALHVLWEAHCTNASDVALAFSRGVLATLEGFGLLDEPEVDRWADLLGRCPGHPCQASWCAYCGDASGWPLCPPGQCDPCDRRRGEKGNP